MAALGVSLVAGFVGSFDAVVYFAEGTGEMPKDPAFTQFYAATNKIYYLWLILGWIPTLGYILDAVAVGRPTTAVTTTNGDIMRGITTSLTGALYLASIVVLLVYEP